MKMPDNRRYIIAVGPIFSSACRNLPGHLPFAASRPIHKCQSTETKSSIRRLRPSSLLVLSPLLSFFLVVLDAASTSESSPASQAASPAIRPIQAPAKPPNKTLPAIEPARTESVPFSDSPTDDEITGFGGFPEALVPIGAKTTAADNRAVAALLQSWRNRTDPESFELIDGFISGQSKSPWAAALLINKGLECRRLGYFSKALAAWQEAWKRGNRDTSPQGRALMDRAAGELAELNARLGRYEWLEPFFKEIDGRNIQGSATEKIAGARQGLWLMRNKPEDAFRCGPMALDRIRARISPDLAFDPKVVRSRSTLKGMPLTEVSDLARRLGMKLVMAKRDSGATLTGLVPAVIHWKAGHYAALTGEDNGRYRVEDPTFGDTITVSQRAINEEGSGYFLISAPANNRLPSGWHLVSAAEGTRVWGKGNTGSNDPSRTGERDKKVDDCPKPPGMTQYNVHAMLVSLNLVDRPLFYTPPRGLPVFFTATYSQREANQPANFTYSNLGRKWTFNWFSYVQDSALSADVPPTIYLSGGGVETYAEVATDEQDGLLVPRVTYWYDTSTNPATRYVETAEYKPQQESRAVLAKIERNKYRKTYPDGSKEIFEERITNAEIVYPRKFLLSKQVDAAGNETTFSYDSLHRLYAVTDSLGQVTVLHYHHATDPRKITKVEDPFGRFATFDYNEAGQLSKITDVQGMTSEFTYGTGDFIDSLTTGYGTTQFAFGEQGPNRWLEVTDPMGHKERTEYRQGAPGIPFSESEENVPQGIPTFNAYINYRNTFYFSKKAYAESFTGIGFDYTKAKIYHWLHSSDINVCSGILESTKEAFENRIWLSYPNQTQALATDGQMQTQPAIVARVMDDGSTQSYRYEYNDFGRMTKSVDPLGRETRYIYYPNGVDLHEVRQKRGATTDLLASYTYFPNKRPETITDAAGKTTHFTYNGYGQLKTMKDALGHITTFGHDDDGYLTDIAGPVSGANTHFEYDGYGRVRQVRNSDQYTVDLEYDFLNRPTRSTYPDGSYEETVYTLLDPEWMRDRLGRWTHNYFDSVRHLVGVLDPEYRFTGYEWCGCGSLEGIIDPLGHKTSWQNDAQGRVISKTYPDRRQEIYQYEPKSGRLTTVIDAMNQQRQQQYYADNALKQVDYISSNRQGVSLSYTYESDYARLASMTDGQGVTGYTYKPVGVLGAGKLATVDGPLDNDTISYSYDELGRNARQAINGVAETPHYDTLGRIDSVTNALGTFGYHYDGVSSRLSSIDLPNGQQTTFGYHDNQGDRALSNITHLASGGGIISKFDYAYSAPGRISDWTQQQGSQPAVKYKLGYDSVDQLRKATLRNVSNQAVLKRYVYDYDAAGNRTSEQIDNLIATETPNNVNQLMLRTAGGRMKVNGALTEPATVTVNGVPARVDSSNQFEGSASVTTGSNQLEVVATDGNGNHATKRYQVNVPFAAGVTQEYDFNGNLTSKSAGANTTNYEWDAADRLIAINIGTHRTEIKYDALSRKADLIEKESGSIVSEKRFLWCGNDLCEERDSDGGTVTKRFFGQGEQRVGGSDAGLYCYTRDHLGSVREVTDASGVVHARYDYGVWGEQSKIAGDLDCDFAFTGFYLHSRSGLNFSRTRAYDSDAGRWISRDPITENGGLNLYEYVGNSPLQLVDPFGLVPDPYGFDEAESLGTMGSQRGIDIARQAPQIVQDRAREGVAEVGMAALPELGLFERLLSWFKLGRKCKAVEAAVDNGYVDLGGFKFSEKYYQKLFDTGRTAPVTVAREVLASATSKTADRLPGFFRYEGAGWEMVYNPTTREVWHLQPLK